MTVSKKTRKLKRIPYGWIYLFLAPTLILFTMYTLYPLGATVWYSLTNMRSFTSVNLRFVGIANYKALFADKQFINSVKVTGQFLLYSVPARFIISLLLALILNSKLCKWRTFFRTMFFLPVLTTSAVIGVVFIMLLDPTMGPINTIMKVLGMNELASQSLLGVHSTALLTTAVVWVWKWLGNSLIYWIASLQSIPDELYEASKIDGANAWQTFRHIVVPLLIPFAVIILLLTVSDAIRVFNLMLTLTNGGPYFATETVELFIYRHGFQASQPRLAYASAAATIFGVFFMVIVLIQNAASSIANRKENR